MDIRIITKPIKKKEAEQIAEEFYVTMVKGVVDIEREIIALGGEYHLDANMVLMEKGSRQENVWGFNLHFDRDTGDALEYTALINIRPHANNRGMLIEDESVRQKIEKLVEKLIV